MGDTLVSSMAAAIRQMEGTNPNFAANNNPGNLVYIGPNQNGQSGVQPGAGGFARFPSPDAGEAALESQIQYQISQGQDLTQFFNQYAPGNTKNAAGGVQTPAATQNYINFVSSQLGIDPSVPLNSVQSGSYSPGASTSDSSSSDSPSTFDISSLLPSDFSSLNPFGDSDYNLGPVVLSGSDLFALSLAVVAGLAVSAIL